MSEESCRLALLEELQESADYHLGGAKVHVDIPEDGFIDIYVEGMDATSSSMSPWLMGAEQYRHWMYTARLCKRWQGKGKKCKVYRYTVRKPTTFASVTERHIPEGVTDFKPMRPCDMMTEEERDWRKSALYQTLTGKCGV